MFPGPRPLLLPASTTWQTLTIKFQPAVRRAAEAYLARNKS